MSIKRVVALAVALLGLLAAMPVTSVDAQESCNPCAGPKSPP